MSGGLAPSPPKSPVRTVERPEIVIGLVGGVGTDFDMVEESLAQALNLVGYRCGAINIATLMHEMRLPAQSDSSVPAPRIGLECSYRQSRSQRLVRHRESLRLSLGPAVGAWVAATKINADRIEATCHSGSRDHLPTADREREREGHATILRSLERREEIDELRSAYGPRFIVVGVRSSPTHRVQAIEAQLRYEEPHRRDGVWYAHSALAMIEREGDERREAGARVREAMEAADFFLSAGPGYRSNTQEACRRLVALLFGDLFETPTAHEYAMNLAAASAVRSSAGRQVGSVVVDDDGEILVASANEVPKAGGGQYWNGDLPDNRDFQQGYDVNIRQQLFLAEDIMDRLQRRGWINKDVVGEEESLGKKALKKDGPLYESLIREIREFGRTVHAEMACICTAARQGKSLRRSRMYTTAYPCHECARLIIAAGVREVVYLVDYPQSRTEQMYRQEITSPPSSGGSAEGVVFTPYEGVAPRLYNAVFTHTARHREELTGRYQRWRSEYARPRLIVDIGVTSPPQPFEEVLMNKLVSRLKERTQRADTEQQRPTAGDGMQPDREVGESA